MNWKIASLVALAMWSIYGFFGERSAKIHGEKVNMIFETLAFIVLAFIAAASGIGDFKKVTGNSAFNASIMGLLSAGGFWFILYAFKVVPQSETFLVLLISGMFPVIAAIINNFIVSPLTICQWIGVVMAGAGLVLVSWK